MMEDIFRKAAETTTITTSVITQSLVDYCFNVTKNTREFMESNPSQRQPHVSLEYPGKLDHTSACAFTVGPIESLSLGI